MEDRFVAKTRRRITRREIKEDRFIVWLFEAGEFLRKNIQPILIGVAVVIIAVSAGYLWSNQRTNNLLAAGKLLAPGQTAMQLERYEDAIPIFDRVISEFDGTPIAMEATIQLAKAYFFTGEITGARNSYVKYVDNYGGDDKFYTISAKAGIAACDEQTGKFLDAATSYLELANDDTDSFLYPKFLLDAGRCFQAADQLDRAKELYEKILTSHETTRYARNAKIALTTF